MAQVQLDDLDRQLISILGTDARVSNRKIAVELGVTEGTVRGRIRRLQQDGLITFTAITGLEMEDKYRIAFISVQADVENVREIARAIAKLPLVKGVMISMGQFNILAMCLFNELEDLVEVSSDRMLALPGVHHVETSIAVRTLKYNVRMAKIANLPETE